LQIATAPFAIDHEFVLVLAGRKVNDGNKLGGSRSLGNRTKTLEHDRKLAQRAAANLQWNFLLPVGERPNDEDLSPSIGPRERSWNQPCPRNVNTGWLPYGEGFTIDLRFEMNHQLLPSAKCRHCLRSRPPLVPSIMSGPFRVIHAIIQLSPLQLRWALASGFV
jgi:hypothetical protein